MNRRECIMAAMRREEPERVPLGIHLAAAKYEEFVARTGETDPYEYFDLDYRHVPLVPPPALPDFSQYFVGRVPDWPDTSASHFALNPFRGNTHFFVMGEHNTAMNEWGEYRIYGKDRDYHRKVAPLNHPGCTVTDIVEYPFPDLFAPYRYEGIEEGICALHERGLAAVLSWEMTVFEKAWRVRGMEALMMDLVDNPDLVECLLDEIARRTGYLAMRYAQAGVDIVQFGDDIGSQRGMMISPEHWRRYLKPRVARIIADVREVSPEVLIFYHSDGDVDPVIPDLIEIGVDILNPVQAECMDIARLKQSYGDRLSFWGGIGVQTTMPFGKPRDVRAAVRQLIGDAGRGGGLVVAPAHHLERDTPWENIEALVTAVRDFGG
jgi:uroporphyrinogen decarboxylase